MRKHRRLFAAHLRVCHCYCFCISKYREYSAGTPSTTPMAKTALGSKGRDINKLPYLMRAAPANDAITSLPRKLKSDSLMMEGGVPLLLLAVLLLLLWWVEGPCLPADTTCNAGVTNNKCKVK
eukprot:GHUV01026882.1.p1 GENE.GHUV01026882.1~~GHUV01026882.1.p1  ORF type:complete len:123 (-),score=20.40 GHUV01026882.1:473-841(-)